MGSYPSSSEITASIKEFQGRLQSRGTEEEPKGMATDKSAGQEESGRKLKNIRLLLLLFHIVNARGTHAYNFAQLNSKNG